MSDSIVAFKNAIRRSGLEPPSIIEPGILHRFPGKGKSPSNSAAWCRLFEDGLGGCFGDWSSGLYRNWQAAAKSRSPSERVARNRKFHLAREERLRDLERVHVEAAHRAAVIWSAAKPIPPSHPYLSRKRIGASGAKLHKDAVVLPLQDFSGQLTSLQFISPDGSKVLLKGGRKKGCFIHVSGQIDSPHRVIVCEGWATGCTLATEDPDALILAAVDAGNLKAIALSARCRWPAVEIVVAGDDDRLTPGNPGKRKAHDAAVAAKALLALPTWPTDVPENLTDFNDLDVWLKGGNV